MKVKSFHIPTYVSSKGEVDTLNWSKNKSSSLDFANHFDVHIAIMQFMPHDGMLVFFEILHHIL